MTARQIRLAVMASGLIAVSLLVNLLAMQPDDGRGVRPDRHYRGLSGLPGTPSTSLGEPVASEAAPSQAKREGAGAPTPPAESMAGPALVAQVQIELAKRGYVPGNSNGTIDMVTRAAIMAFEYDRGRDLTAEPSAAVLAELKSDVPTGAATSGVRKTSAEAEGVIKAVQQSLARLTYRPGTADGVMGQATAAAIRTFERDQRLPETGRVSGLLLTRLALVGADGRVAQR